jgi:hypothetical protein
VPASSCRDDASHGRSHGDQEGSERTQPFGPTNPRGGLPEFTCPEVASNPILTLFRDIFCLALPLPRRADRMANQ